MYDSWKITQLVALLNKDVSEGIPPTALRPAPSGPIQVRHISLHILPLLCPAPTRFSTSLVLPNFALTSLTPSSPAPSCLLPSSITLAAYSLHHLHKLSFYFLHIIFSYILHLSLQLPSLPCYPSSPTSLSPSTFSLFPSIIAFYFSLFSLWCFLIGLITIFYCFYFTHILFELTVIF